MSNWQDIEQQLKKAQVVLEPSARLIPDSRQVTPGDIFIATKGFDQDGSLYINSALELGAVAILVSDACDKTSYHKLDNVILVEGLEKKLATIAKEFYVKDQSVPMPVIGVTGTNGKTSISHLLAQLSQICLQQESAVIGTIGTGSINDLQPSSNTTPGVTEIYRLIKQFSAKNYGSLTMEVSSHALDQGRIEGLDLDVAIFTNLTLDHLDYHGNMESYFNAKAKLFTEYLPKCAVLNVDDQYGRRIADMVANQTRVVAFGQSESVKAYSDYVFIRGFECHVHGLSIDIEWQVIGAKETCFLQLPIYGEFNCLNLAAVFATALTLNWPIVAAHFSQLRPVPGRLELFVKPNLPVAVVDYAHTPDALEQSLLAVRKHLTGELYVIFGCGGERDVSKRPIMGKLAEQHADHVIITNDNPRTESEDTIIADIEAGMSGNNYQIIKSRKEAIDLALRTATASDAILIAGKGHEIYQVIGKESIDYNERDYVEKAMLALTTHGGMI
ncbi:MAG: UDP-N-acetylmuramoyl-L-alanyl-D-glutamate--2,6-diaminopimelate ligase [Psychrosphaera sp.]|jgi:UDP-N-acetylmuramoyl-L-alanyl-D-glutamate--2,6-diaminopimelate ligase|uniref:UDP-N-acetylmuramoyl-L-alanyl-D-glutamate--2, 6-diaminopimelate ligase n=1 Tax=uncultured Psychrosphaera sp. TaxID=1403522 RepID=UPI0030F5889E